MSSLYIFESKSARAGQMFGDYFHVNWYSRQHVDSREIFLFNKVSKVEMDQVDVLCYLAQVH